MEWLGNIGRSVGNFFGGLFGGGSDDEDERRRRQQQQQRPTVQQPDRVLPLSLASIHQTPQEQERATPVMPSILETKEDKRPTTQQQRPTVQQPRPLTLEAIQQRNQPQQRNYRGRNLTGLNEQDTATAIRLADEGKDVDSFLQAARRADAAAARARTASSPAAIVGGTISSVPRILAGETLTRPVDIASRIAETGHRLATGNTGDYSRYEEIREGLSRANQAISGMDLGSKEDLDSLAERISTGQANWYDYPIAFLESLDPIGVAGAARRTGARALRGTINNFRRAPDSTPTVRTPSRDPGSAITAPTRPTPRDPAITSANPNRLPVEAPTPRPTPEPTPPPRPEQPDPLPDLVLEAETPAQQAARREAAEQLAREAELEQQAIRQAEVEQALEEAAPPPPEAPTAPVSEVLESPSTTAARQAAEEATPVDTRAVQAQAARQAEAQAPTEAAAMDVPEGAVARIDDGLDIERARVQQELDEIDQILRADGTNYDQLAAKMYHNDMARTGRAERATTDVFGTDPVPYTPAEEAAVARIREIMAESAEMIYRNTLGDLNIARRTSDYTPAGTPSEADIPRTVSAAADTLGDASFNLRREGTMTPEQVSGGARRAYEQQRVHALASERYTPEQVRAGRQTHHETVDKQLFEGDIDNIKGEKPIALSDQDVQGIRDRSQPVVDREVEYIDTMRRYEAEKQAGDVSPQTADDVVQAQAELRRAMLNKQAEDLAAFRAKVKAEDQRIMREYRAARGNSARRRELQQQKASLARRSMAAEAKLHYRQTTIDTNLLFQPRGRIADMVQTAAEKPTLSATDVLGRRAANLAHRRSTGRNLFGSNREARRLYKQFTDEGVLSSRRRDNYAINRRLEQAEGGGLSGVRDRLNTVATLTNEAASLERKPLTDTIATFLAKGEDAGLEGKALHDWVRRQIDTEDWRAVYDVQWNAANSFTGVASFGRKGGDIVERGLKTGNEKITDWVHSIPQLPVGAQRYITKGLQRVLTGYTRAAYRVTKRQMQRVGLGIDNYIRAGALRGDTPQINAERAQLIRQAVQDTQAGAATYAAGIPFGAYLASQGWVSGAYPEDQAERARWASEGITPYSIKLGENGPWFNLSRYLPQLHVPIMAGALSADGGSEGNLWDALIEVGQGAYENTGMPGVVGTIHSLTGDLGDSNTQRELSWLTAGAINMNIPLYGLLTTTGRATDDTRRDTTADSFGESVINNMQSQLPGLRNQMDPQTDAFGNERPNTRSSSLLYTSAGTESTPVTEELSRLAQAGIEAFPTGRRDYQLKNADGGNIDLDRSQQNELNNAVRQERERQASLLMETDSYRQADDQRKAELLKEVYSTDRNAIAAQWAKEKGIGGVKDVAPDISSDLEPNLQRALVEYSAQGDRKDVWLENTQNALDYYTAVYRNKEANGTLTEKDKTLSRMNSPAYKMEAAKVNHELGATPELLLKYETTTVTQFRNMPEGPEKEALRQLDLARAAAGVSRNSSDKSKPKYGSSSSSRGRGSGGRGRATVSLPSIRGGTRTGDSSGSGYTRGTRLYNPQVALRAPEASASVETPSISVRRGVHL